MDLGSEYFAPKERGPVSGLNELVLRSFHGEEGYRRLGPPEPTEISVFDVPTDSAEGNRWPGRR